MYRSGDLARWLSNGEIEFLGRIDHQVKIRGFRIECGEIESALLAIQGVSAAAVIARTDAQNEKYLCAYFVADEEKTVHELRGLLSKTLPEFMVPARFVQLEKLPLTGSGKTDRRALPSPGEEINTGKVFVAPTSEKEKMLIKVWAETLGIRADAISMQDDFFELGGNSLKAVMLISKIELSLQLKLPIQLIFQHATPQALMSHLEKRRVDFPEYDPHVFPLQPRGSKTPLFIVPGIEGKCFYLNELAKSFGLDQPVYGLQYVGSIKGEKPFDSIEQMAAFNIGLMKKLQPQGPYLLAGHSMGGWVAMEMAHQLHQQGEKIGFLGLLDSYSPKVHALREGFQIHSQDQEINDLLMLAERLLEYSGSTANFQELKESLAQIDSNLSLSNLQQWTVSNGLIPSDFSVEDLGQWAKLIGTNSRIHFEPKKTAESTTLFKAVENNHVEQAIADCLGWSATVSQLNLQETPGNHFSMMYHPHVTSLAAAIQDCIQSDGRNPETVKKSEQNERPKPALEYQESKF